MSKEPGEALAEILEWAQQYDPMGAQPIDVAINELSQFRELLAAARYFAALKDCDEEPEKCYSDSGPYCGKHNYNYVHSNQIKNLRAALAAFDGKEPSDACADK